MFKIVRPTDHPSNREPVRPTVRPDLLRRKTNIVSAATTSTLFIATAAEGRGTSFVVSFVVAMSGVDVVDLNVNLVDVDLDVDLVDVDLDVVPFCGRCPAGGLDLEKS